MPSTKLTRWTLLTAWCLGAALLQAAPVYLNDQNITVALGPSMAAEPFANRTTADSLASVIDAPSAIAPEDHGQGTHVWVSGGPLELVFDFGQEYDLTTLHFWNYFSEGFDVDTIVFTFFSSANVNVGSLEISPALGGDGGNPIFAEDIVLAAPLNVQFVNALLTGSNNQVDFNNVGFTGGLSSPSSSVPEPGTFSLLTLSLLGAAWIKRKAKRDIS